MRTLLRCLLAAALLVSGAAAAEGPLLGFPQRKGGVEKALRRTPLWFPSGRKITVEVVDNPVDRERGLMFRKKLPKDYGMLFVFPQPMGLQFWMKNTFVSLDIVYIGEDKTVTRVHQRVRPSTPETPDDKVARVGGFGHYVLELPAGTAAKEKLLPGQSLTFGVPIPDR